MRLVTQIKIINIFTQLNNKLTCLSDKNLFSLLPAIPPKTPAIAIKNNVPASNTGTEPVTTDSSRLNA